MKIWYKTFSKQLDEAKLESFDDPELIQIESPSLLEDLEGYKHLDEKDLYITLLDQAYLRIEELEDSMVGSLTLLRDLIRELGGEEDDDSYE